MIRIVFLFLLLSFSYTSFGQTESTKVYLKDGSILIGQIIEDNDYFIKIVIASIDTMEIGYKHIESVGKVPRKRRTARFKPDHIVKTSGLFVSAMGSIHQTGAYEESSVRPELIFGRRIRKNLNLGLMIGYEVHAFSNNLSFGTSHFLTLGAYGRLYLSNKKSRWFVDSQLGYGIPTSEEIWGAEYSHIYNGGVNAHSGVGLHFKSRRKHSFLLRMGLGYQHVTGDVETNWNGNVQTKYRREYIYPYWGVGIEF